MTAEVAKSRFNVEGKRIVVTGASQGLGRGIAIALAEAGATVVGVARSQQRLDELAAIINPASRFEALSADLSLTSEIDLLVDRIWSAGAVWGVVHAAGIQVRKPAFEITSEDWDRVTTVQLRAPFFLSRAIASRQQSSAGGGSHVFIGSLTSWIGRPNITPYAASKAGVLGVTRSLACEWAAAGIRVNAICPGYFHTALTNDLFSDEAQRQRILDRIPMGRLGVPDDLVGAMVFLLSTASSYVTGQAINVDGGWLAT